MSQTLAINPTPYTYADNFAQFLTDVEGGHVVECDSSLFRYFRDVLPPILHGGTVTMPDNRKQHIAFGFAEGSDLIWAFWSVPGADEFNRFFCQRTGIINRYGQTRRHPAPQAAEAAGIERTWFKNGEKYTAGNQPDVIAAIEEMPWQTFVDGLSLPFSQGFAIKAAIKEFAIDDVAAVGYTSAFGAYSLLGIDYQDNEGRARLFMIDTGTGVAPILLECHSS